MKTFLQKIRKNSSRIILDFLIFFAVVFVISWVVLVMTVIYDNGYKDGYCSSVEGVLAGDSRVCITGGTPIQIP